MIILWQISAMRLVRQVSLYFRGGNSDKIYEIDLCGTGNDFYVVNFRYGRRGTPLKEGTKTPDPVSLYQAEEIFSGLETEKRSKGYKPLVGINEPETPQPIKALFIPQTDIQQLLPGRKKAILQRLHDGINEKVPQHFPWKVSRVIWMAGVMRIEEATDAILFLATKGDTMQLYAAVWALGRCGAQEAAPLFLSQFKSGITSVQRIAGAALVKVAEGAEKEKHLQYYLHSLPAPFQLAIKNNDEPMLKTLLQERVLAQSQPHYNWLEDLYLLSQTHPWIKKSLKELLIQMPLKPGYFKQVRHIFKLAEFFDDFEIVALLAHRFEKEEEMLRAGNTGYDDEGKVFVTDLNEYINLKKELSKKSSRLAYSAKTRQYLIRRNLRLLRNYGAYNDVCYVRLATALLLTYDKDKDYTAPYSIYNSIWNGRNYNRIENKFPANASAVYLNEILFGASMAYKLSPKNVWTIVDPAKQQSQSNNKQANKGQQNIDTGNGIVGKIISFFTGKKSAAVSETPLYETVPLRPSTAETTAVVPLNEAPHLALWNQLPQAYIQLLMEGRMEEVHRFAITHLYQHPDYTSIKDKLDASAIEHLLLSDFTIPAEFAFTLAQERYNPTTPDAELVKAMLYGKLEKAQQKAIAWVEEARDFFLSDPAFVAALLLCPNVTCRTWISNLISDYSYSEDVAQAIVVRTIAHILNFKDDTPEINESIQQGGLSLLRRFPEALNRLNLQVVEQLMQSKISSAQLLGIDILLLQKDKFNIDQLSDNVFSSALHNAYTPLRIKGMELLNAVSTPGLLKRQELVIYCCIAEYPDVRSLVRPIIKRVADQEPSFGVHAAEWLLPYLLRKESSEGLHKDVADILRHELIGYIKDVNKALVLQLLYSAFVPTQEFGITLLQTAVDPKELSIRQIIALGNHETKSVREWVWNYFEGNIARIKYEREDAIRLLDAAWDDIREFAKAFFKKHFAEGDWTAEVLVGLADSIRPDIEAYGRELITRFFRDEQGEEYLIKLSQHPSEKMQLFATNYFERFAANDLTKLVALEFYFRAVLTRVNKARVAKNRIFRFLGEEGKKSEDAAQFVTGLISQISATVSIEDKAKCIEILLALQTLYDVQTPLKKIPVEERV